MNIRQAHRYPWFFALAGAGLALTAVADPIAVVENGEARAVVVTAGQPSLVAAYAVEELVEHVEKATGVRLPVAVETAIPAGYASRIFVGDTQAARAQGLDPDSLEVEAYRLHSVGSDVYVLGRELPEYTGELSSWAPTHPLSAHCVHSGTLFGVYDLLERFVGVRWLWPGDLGTYVPRTDSLAFDSLDETVKPRLLYRDLGGWGMRHRMLSGILHGGRIINPRPLQFSNIDETTLRHLIFPTVEAGHEYGLAMEVFQRRHRRVLAAPDQIRVPRTTHFVAGIRDWWAEHGATHPEWFAMRADGGRGRETPRAGAYTALCVSNERLRDFIVNEAWDGGDILQMGEADVGGEGLCQCPRCMALDGPQSRNFPEIVRPKYTPRVMSERYASFWKAVYDRAVQRNPNVKMPVYLYHNTLPAPQTDIRLNRNIIGEFVIYGDHDGWFPMSEEEYRWTLEQWQGWARTGISLFHRPNYLHSTYTTPNVVTWQSGEFFRFAYANGMIGTYYDALGFAWAAQGPMAYMHYRLAWNPETEIADIRREYFEAFGPAARTVEEYFDYWENYTRTRPPISELGPLEKLRRPRGHALAYPPEVYDPAQALLNRALGEASADPLPEFAERVRFLQAGLEHALLSTRIHDYLDYEGPDALRGSAPVGNPVKLRQARIAMQDLIRFRHDPANRFVSSYIDNAQRERSFIGNLQALFAPVADIPPAPPGSAHAAESPPRPQALLLQWALPRDDWRFKLDPAEEAHGMGWTAPEFDDTDWATLSIEQPWQAAGYEYTGAAWYRRTFPLPEKPEGATSARLYFEGVDETARVWLNGVYVGEHDIGPQGWNVAFTIDSTEAARWGQDNHITVRVRNTNAAGGIWRPVSLQVLGPAGGAVTADDVPALPDELF